MCGTAAQLQPLGSLCETTPLLDHFLLSQSIEMESAATLPCFIYSFALFCSSSVLLPLLCCSMHAEMHRSICSL